MKPTPPTPLRTILLATALVAACCADAGSTPRLFTRQRTITPQQNAQALIDAGHAYPAAVVESEQHPFLMQLAQEHAEYMARARRQDHQGWDGRNGRFQRVLAKFGQVQTQEICNESWRGQSLEDAAHEMWRSWQLSEGHWSVASKRHRLAGFGMALGRSGVWYACVVVVD